MEYQVFMSLDVLIWMCTDFSGQIGRVGRAGVALYMREGLDFMELTYSDERVECLWVSQEKGRQGSYCGRRML